MKRVGVLAIQGDFAEHIAAMNQVEGVEAFPVKKAEEIATLDHMLKGRLYVGFTRGYHARWVDAYASVKGVGCTKPANAKAGKS